jgi:hypothetical protein
VINSLSIFKASNDFSNSVFGTLIKCGCASEPQNHSELFVTRNQLVRKVSPGIKPRFQPNRTKCTWEKIPSTAAKQSNALQMNQIQSILKPSLLFNSRKTSSALNNSSSQLLHVSINQ